MAVVEEKDLTAGRGIGKEKKNVLTTSHPYFPTPFTNAEAESMVPCICFSTTLSC